MLSLFQSCVGLTTTEDVFSDVVPAVQGCVAPSSTVEPSSSSASWGGTDDGGTAAWLMGSSDDSGSSGAALSSKLALNAWLVAARDVTFGVRAALLASSRLRSSLVNMADETPSQADAHESARDVARSQTMIGDQIRVLERFVAQWVPRCASEAAKMKVKRLARAHLSRLLVERGALFRALAKMHLAVVRLPERIAVPERVQARVACNRALSVLTRVCHDIESDDTLEEGPKARARVAILVEICALRAELAHPTKMWAHAIDTRDPERTLTPLNRWVLWRDAAASGEEALVELEFVHYLERESRAAVSGEGEETNLSDEAATGRDVGDARSIAKFVAFASAMRDGCAQEAMVHCAIARAHAAADVAVDVANYSRRRAARQVRYVVGEIAVVVAQEASRTADAAAHAAAAHSLESHAKEMMVLIRAVAVAWAAAAAADAAATNASLDAVVRFVPAFSWKTPAVVWDESGEATASSLDSGCGAIEFMDQRETDQGAQLKLYDGRGWVSLESRKGRELWHVEKSSAAARELSRIDAVRSKSRRSMKEMQGADKQQQSKSDGHRGETLASRSQLAARELEMIRETVRKAAASAIGSEKRMGEKRERPTSEEMEYAAQKMGMRRSSMERIVKAAAASAKEEGVAGHELEYVELTMRRAMEGLAGAGRMPKGLPEKSPGGPLRAAAGRAKVTGMRLRRASMERILRDAEEAARGEGLASDELIQIGATMRRAMEEGTSEPDASMTGGKTAAAKTVKAKTVGAAFSAVGAAVKMLAKKKPRPISVGGPLPPGWNVPKSPSPPPHMGMRRTSMEKILQTAEEAHKDDSLIAEHELKKIQETMRRAMATGGGDKVRVGGVMLTPAEAKAKAKVEAKKAKQNLLSKVTGGRFGEGKTRKAMAEKTNKAMKALTKGKFGEGKHRAAVAKAHGDRLKKAGIAIKAHADTLQNFVKTPSPQAGGANDSSEGDGDDGVVRGTLSGAGSIRVGLSSMSTSPVGDDEDAEDDGKKAKKAKKKVLAKRNKAMSKLTGGAFGEGKHRKAVAAKIGADLDKVGTNLLKHGHKFHEKAKKAGPLTEADKERMAKISRAKARLRAFTFMTPTKTKEAVARASWGTRDGNTAAQASQIAAAAAAAEFAVDNAAVESEWESSMGRKQKGMPADHLQGTTAPMRKKKQKKKAFTFEEIDVGAAKLDMGGGALPTPMTAAVLAPAESESKLPAAAASTPDSGRGVRGPKPPGGLSVRTTKTPKAAGRRGRRNSMMK